jgi:dimethylaniline monooxygenase (N-oxide forming)
MKKVAIIGAGASGVRAAKIMMDAGFDVSVFEAGSYVGGLWVYENDNGRAQAYRSLSIISSRSYTHFEDYPFDDKTPRFPTHWDMHRYMNSYAEHFGIKELIRFNTRVSSVDPLFTPNVESPVWRVTTENGFVDTYDGVIVATGHNNEPLQDKRFEAFTGEYLHSSSYRFPDPFVGKRVCVVGTGNSGMDIASGVCQVAARTVIVARSGVEIKPKVFWGVPFADIGIKMRKRWIPNWVRTKVTRGLTYAAHGDLTKLGFQKPTRKIHGTFSESIVMDIEFNRVFVKPDIVQISGTELTFADGTREDFDVLVGATGYRVHLPFLTPELVPIKGNHVDLYKRIFVPDWPGLTFVGMINPLAVLNRIVGVQSMVIARCLMGDVLLPSKEAMLEDIADKNKRTADVYTSSPRHELEEPDFNYVQELQDLVAEGSVRARKEGFLPLRRLRRILTRRAVSKSLLTWPPDSMVSKQAAPNASAHESST